MHPLLMLYRLQMSALRRRVFRGLGSVKGAFLFVFGLMVVGLWVAPAVWSAHAGPRTDPAVVREVTPVILLSMCLLALLTSGGEKAVAFTPAEVDFLFPGPFTRRALLAYKLGKILAGVVFSTLILSVVLLRHAAGWAQALAGVLLAMLFVQLVGMAVTLAAQSAGERAYTWTRKVVLGLVIAAAAWFVAPGLMHGERPGVFEVAKRVRDTRVGHAVLAPVASFGNVLTAEDWGAMALWSLAGLGLNGVVLGIVFALDADYLEAAAARSQVAYERMQRVRKGGLTAIAGPVRRVRGRVPTLPFAGGAGPVAWRQMTAAIRNAKGLLFLVVILAVATGPLMFSQGRRGPAQHNSLTGAVVGVMGWLTLVVGSWLRFDFRGDLDQMDTLKALPVRGSALAAGQLVTPTLLMTACHLAIVVSVCVASRRVEGALIAAAALSLPFNVLLFGIENVIFLMFPTRQIAGPADVQGYGRQILVLVAKGAVLLVAVGVAALAGAVVHLAGGGWPAVVATAGVVLTALAAATIPAVAWAFGRFDVAGDLPA